MDLFLVPYSRVLRYRCVKRAQLIAEGYTERSPPSWKLEWYWGVVCCHTRFLCILHVTNVEGIPLANLVRKNNTLHHYPHPLPSLECVTPRSNMITAAHVKYSNCIRYNFFIFCPICMQFLHNILHTYSFILSIIKHNWKIRRFWVVDTLKFYKIAEGHCIVVLLIVVLYIGNKIGYSTFLI